MTTHARTITRTAMALAITGCVALASTPARAQSPRGQRNLVEVGVMLGGFFPASRHELYDVDKGVHRDFEAAAFDAGLRLTYFPVCFAGVELEGALMPTRTTDDVPALVYAARAHAIFQVPARLAPFVLFGAGIMGVSSDTLGSDIDATFNFGAGMKFYATPSIALRVDGRGTMGGQLGSGGRTFSFELLAGVSWVFGMPDRAPTASRAMAVD